MLRGDLRVAFVRVARRAQAHDELGIPEDRNVRVVGREQELASLLLFAHPRHHPFRDETVVQIVLRLIDDERRIGLQEQQ